MTLTKKAGPLEHSDAPLEQSRGYGLSHVSIRIGVFWIGVQSIFIGDSHVVIPYDGYQQRLSVSTLWLSVSTLWLSVSTRGFQPNSGFNPTLVSTQLWEMWNRKSKVGKSKVPEAFFFNSDAARAHLRHIHCLHQMPGRENGISHDSRAASRCRKGGEGLAGCRGTFASISWLLARRLGDSRTRFDLAPSPWTARHLKMQ